MSTRKDIPPNPPRWKPNSDPNTISVPGLDTAASTIDQIEQIEQLITIKLQNIDENFSKIHNVLATKLLPAVKRYAVGTEPVREAAKFWTSFYEQAAQIRIPTYDDHSTVNEMPSEHEETATSTQRLDEELHRQTILPSQSVHESTVVTSESSFFPGQDAFSSTPATARHGGTLDLMAGNESEDPSWTASMESPLVRLSREINSLSTRDEESMFPSNSSVLIQSDEVRQRSTSHQQEPSLQIKGKGKDTTQALLKNVLRHNLYSASDISSGNVGSLQVSPSKPGDRTKTPLIKKFNPYIPPDSATSEWRGIVDLGDPSVLTPQRNKSLRWPPQKQATPQRDYDDDDDDEFDGLPPGMSPPVMLSPVRPRSGNELGALKIGRTPSKEASARIKQDLLRHAQSRSATKSRYQSPMPKSDVESTMSTLPTPPSFSRYLGDESTRSITKDSSLESMMQRLQNDLQVTSNIATTSGLCVSSKASTSIDDGFPSDYQRDFPTPATRDYGNTDQDMDSDSDSLDEINNTAHPSAAFLMASQGTRPYDDSFGSNHSSDSLEDEAVGHGLDPVHPFAQVVEDDGFDDESFDDYNNPSDYPEETVFGVPPAQRLQGQGARRPNPEGLRMLGEELLEDTIGIGAQIAASGKVEESPTPSSWAR